MVAIEKLNIKAGVVTTAGIMSVFLLGVFLSALSAANNLDVSALTEEEIVTLKKEMFLKTAFAYKSIVICFLLGTTTFLFSSYIFSEYHFKIISDDPLINTEFDWSPQKRELEFSEDLNHVDAAAQYVKQSAQTPSTYSSTLPSAPAPAGVVVDGGSKFALGGISEEAINSLPKFPLCGISEERCRETRSEVSQQRAPRAALNCAAATGV